MDQKRGEAALNRHYGARPDARKRMAEAAEKFHDWRGRCRLCGASLEGSMAELKGHVCDGK